MSFSHFTNRFGALQVADNSSLVVSIPLPFNLTLMFVAAICQAMNLWEMTLAVGRQHSTEANDLTDEFYAIWTLFHVEKELSELIRITPPPPGSYGQYIDDIKIIIDDDSAQATIDTLCANTYYSPWDVGSPQPNSPDITDQVRQILDDIDEYGESLPY